MNSSHQMKTFDITIVCFGYLNGYQQHVSLFAAEIWRPLSSLSQTKTKK
jgi:hypothetical protein